MKETGRYQHYCDLAKISRSCKCLAARLTSVHFDLVNSWSVPLVATVATTGAAELVWRMPRVGLTSWC